MFIDRAKIEVRSGKGGDGVIAFLHEKYIEKGGPSGGNGGRGGSIYFIAKNDLNSLIAYRHSRVVIAKDGEKGGNKNQYGRKADDIYLEVPVGTVITNALTNEVLADLNEDGKIALIAKGGRGGRGNAAFKSSRQRVPKIAENGLPGQTFSLILELRLIADVGLVGFPSVGKSTLLSILSEAKPEIADYPFTTLSPNLGVVTYDNFESFVLADLPGLIEGASLGKGLGHDFLRHIKRCSIIVHVVSMSGERDPIEDYKLINKELKQYDELLANKKMIVVASKMDEDGAYELKEKFDKELGINSIGISALTHEGLKELIYKIVQTLKEEPEEVVSFVKKDEMKLYDATKEEKEIFTLKHIKSNYWKIEGESVIRTYHLINISTDEGLLRLINYLKRIGVDDKLKEMGAKDGDTVVLEDFEFEYVE